MTTDPKNPMQRSSPLKNKNEELSPITEEYMVKKRPG